MKRIVAFSFLLLMLCTLISCSREQAPVEKKSEENSLADLNGEFLYRHGEEKMRALKSAIYTTKVLNGQEELGEFETVRVRKGYDGFLYSRRGQNFYSYDGERAYVERDNGAYTAPATMRVFEEYLTKYIFSVCGLNPDLLENFQRDGDVVSYESKNAELLSLYQLAEKPDFVPTSLTGSAKLDEEGVILEESIVLKGDGEEYVLKTVLSDYRSESITVAKPTEPDRFTEVSDIRLPMRLQSAIAAFFAQKDVQASAVSTGTLKLGEQKNVFSEYINTYAKEEAGAYYVSRQTLKTIPELPEESIFYQVLLSEGKKTENRYDVILGEKIWENSEDASTLDWQEALRELIPDVSEFASLVMTEEVGGYSITFKLKDETAKKFAEKIAASMPESGITLQATTVRSCEGTLSIQEESGMLTAISYKVEGGFAGEAGTGDYEGRYSVLLEKSKDVTVPELQAPTATTPGMHPDDMSHEAC